MQLASRNMAGGLLEGAAIQKERIEETVTRLEGIQWIGNTTNTVSTNVNFKVAALRCLSLPKFMVNKGCRIQIKHLFGDMVSLLNRSKFCTSRFTGNEDLNLFLSWKNYQLFDNVAGPALLVFQTQCTSASCLVHTPHSSCVSCIFPYFFALFPLDYDYICSETDFTQVIFIQLQESPILPFWLLLLCQK